MIAALFVLKNGPYFSIHEVDPWDETRDAKKYNGPHPVIAHPPCERWGRYWSGGPSAKFKRKLGDDNGCFESALSSVRKWGGILEHPEASHAWNHFGLARPPWHGGWIPAGDGIGFTCCVSQGHYGHRARKMTWLYAVNVPLYEFKWGPSKGKVRLDLGYHSKEERRRAVRTGICQRLSKRQCAETPQEFRDILIEMVRNGIKHTPHCR